MQHIYINNVDVLNLGLIPINIDIPSPEPRLYTIDVPGRNGTLDVTDFMGEIRYKNILITATFETTLKDYQARQILNQYNGQEITLKLISSDAVEQYSGRVKSYTITKNNATCAVSLSVDAQPGVSYVSN